MLTAVGIMQTTLMWHNFTHGFISPLWQIAQQEYLQEINNPASPATWAANLLCLVLQTACKPWDHRNQVLHWLQPDQVQDTQVSPKIHGQYNRGCSSFPPASHQLLHKGLQCTLQLSHNEKLQWLQSVKAAGKMQWIADAWTTSTQCQLMQGWLIHLNPQQLPNPN